MGTVAEIITLVKQQTGVGSDYDDKIIAGINWAQSQVCAVKFGFLQSVQNLSVLAGQTAVTLPTDFGGPYKFYIIDGTTRYELIEGTYEDIVLCPLATDGRPMYYCIAGINTAHIGYPTADKGYTCPMSYYKRLSDVTALSTSTISTVYKDAPLVSGAIYRTWQGLEKPDFEERSYQQFITDMQIMCSEMPYIGPSYVEILSAQPNSMFGKKNEEP